MNKAHEACGSDEWRQAIREVILPWALGGTDLGDNVLEVGPGYGATTDVLSQSVPRLTSVEIDDELAAILTDRFADVPSVQIVHGDATSLSYADSSFSGAACFTMLHHVATDDLQDRLFAEIARVLRPGAPLVASDSLASDELEAHHEGDTYNPVDPSSLPSRLAAAGFDRVEVRTNPPPPPPPPAWPDWLPPLPPWPPQPHHLRPVAVLRRALSSIRRLHRRRAARCDPRPCPAPASGRRRRANRRTPAAAP